ncbi:MAG: hypothetical protein F4207_04830 [Gemmatimonadetes bacterium]|nr:hypothetical protein [Gemmatimonadota bacterium]MYA76478.1 hypothetical protein [Gemmatimonadota bacterium]MYG15740.1 hypothetical protein [Gemmatimonadota bacterium]MYH20253.1 hypothetical protein [Gemmatimonadota bacterium]MYK98578.1 hypothetical protein [Gemmatimonadota bacterium]
MFLIPEDSGLFRTLQCLVDTRKMVFLAGLPGTGKSLLLQQLAILAHGRGRSPHLLQWDVCRLPFLTNDRVKEHYHEKDGITHAGVRKAVGLWARRAVGQWAETHRDDRDILIGEVPIIGNRLVELVRREQDPVEPLLSDGESAYFAIPTPSRRVRRLIETQRKERSVSPLHEREKGDAQPDIMYALWEDLQAVALRFGLLDETGQSCGAGAYDPDLYCDTYSALLKHRPAGRIDLDMLLSTEGRSVYDLSAGQRDLVPSAPEVEAAIREMEDRFARPEALAQAVEQWYEV